MNNFIGKKIFSIWYMYTFWLFIYINYTELFVYFI